MATGDGIVGYDGYDVVRCVVEVLNTSDATVTVDYERSTLLAYEGSALVGGGNPTGFILRTADGRSIPGSTASLPPGAVDQLGGT